MGVTAACEKTHRLGDVALSIQPDSKNMSHTPRSPFRSGNVLIVGLQGQDKTANVTNRRRVLREIGLRCGNGCPARSAEHEMAVGSGLSAVHEGTGPEEPGWNGLGR